MNGIRARALAITSARGWFVVAAVYAVMTALIFARFWHWGPDARFYLAQTYHFGGLSEHEAGRRTYEFLLHYSWFKDYCYFACEPNSPQASFSHLFHGDMGGLVATRVVYPLLSVPFVWLFGPQGMLAVPFLAYAATVVMVMSVASRLFGRGWAVFAAVAMLVPTTFSSYSIYAYTESLAMAFAMGCIMFLPLGQPATRRRLVWFGVMLLLFAFTRQFHPIILAAVVLAWLSVAATRRSVRNEWLGYVGISFGVTIFAAIVQSLAGSGYSATAFFMDQSGARESGLIPAIARVMAKIIKRDIWDMGLDPALVVVCMLAALAIFYRYRTPLAALTLGSLLGTLALNVLNTEPSHLRYYVTAYPLIVLAATMALSELLRGNAFLAQPGTLVSPAPASDENGWADSFPPSRIKVTRASRSG
jgi:hypothetical protein